MSSVVHSSGSTRRSFGINMLCRTSLVYVRRVFSRSRARQQYPCRCLCRISTDPYRPCLSPYSAWWVYVPSRRASDEVLCMRLVHVISFTCTETASVALTRRSRARPLLSLELLLRKNITGASLFGRNSPEHAVVDVADPSSMRTIGRVQHVNRAVGRQEAR